uniref:Uncharacterized protein n=1 Tax=Arundo donax TaxID=35708 RepID=A0A0A9GIJ8_ARUDO
MKFSKYASIALYLFPIMRVSLYPKQFSLHLLNVAYVSSGGAWAKI